MATKSTVEVDGRRLALSNLDKVLYPETGFTKGEVIDYYARIASVLLPHIAGRPMSFKRFPDGVEGQGFFAKNAPRGTPEWVRTVRLPAPGSSMDRETVDYVVIDDLPTLIWAANLAALEMHVPQWTVGPRGAVREADLIVFDLDPGAPATIVECSRVAVMVRDALAADGLSAYPKTSGSKGMQVYAAVKPVSSERTSHYAHELAKRLESEHPDLVVSRMTKDLRGGKVFVDWSQNNGAKTTVAPYSLRARPKHSVSTPLTWDEVTGCRRPEHLQFLAGDTLDRVEKHGDLFEPLLAKKRPPLP
ncbi:MAG: bifunctional non-ous end joining protein LigD [Actinomycetota bacterium]|nr:bifunctional non-ous end joining protein LigD [Actinomycetota bacterium]MDQ1643490.1 bifunctional non-ous end joining protein LigD [Actinomycetota bacterium]